MKPTRERILEYLSSTRAATAVQISRVLQVTATDIRHHLRSLVKEGLVEQGGRSHPGTRGRPRVIYRLTKIARPDNLVGLLEALLAYIPEDQHEQWLENVARHLVSETQDKNEAGYRLYQTIQRLNELHYQARWEAHAKSPKLILGNCPYAIIIDAHPELCRMDKYLLSQLSGLVAVQLEKLLPGVQGGLQCVFHLMTNK